MDVAKPFDTPLKPLAPYSTTTFSFIPSLILYLRKKHNFQLAELNCLAIRSCVVLLSTWKS